MCKEYDNCHICIEQKIISPLDHLVAHLCFSCIRTGTFTVTDFKLLSVTADQTQTKMHV